MSIYIFKCLYNAVKTYLKIFNTTTSTRITEGNKSSSFT